MTSEFLENLVPRVSPFNVGIIKPRAASVFCVLESPRSTSSGESSHVEASRGGFYNLTGEASSLTGENQEAHPSMAGVAHKDIKYILYI